jgi:hypothetical protein
MEDLVKMEIFEKYRNIFEKKKKNLEEERKTTRICKACDNIIFSESIYYITNIFT